MAKRVYIVQTGESLSSIARDELGDMSRWQEIAYINSISEPYTIYAGQTLWLPSDEPLEVEITEYGGQAAPTREASFVFNPATVALIVIGAALLFLGSEK